jgi:hypothetical protein
MRRLAVLDTLRRDHPDVAWKLMLELLPEHHAVGSYSHTPRFRTWKSETEGVTQAEFWEFSSAVAQRLTVDAGQVVPRWLDLVEHLSRLPPTERSSALARLYELATSETLDPTLRERVWGELDKMIRQHRSFPDAEWVLPGEELDKIAAVADAFKPDDPRVANTWLFNAHLPDIGGARADYHEQEARVQEARASAVLEILVAHGLDGLVQFAEDVEFPGAVGVAAASKPSPELEERVLSLLDDHDVKRASFARGFVFQRARDAGMAWVEASVLKLTDRPLSQARLLQVPDDLPAAWKLVAELGREVEGAYWREFSPLGRGDFQLVNEAAAALLRFGRPLTALDLLALYARKEDRRVSPDLIVEALQALVQLPKEHEEPVHLSSYELQTLLDYLRDSDVDQEKLGLLEWQLLPALGFEARSPVLERRLARDAEFFVEILSLVYRSRDDEAETVEVPEQTATNAYRLLDEWRIVPGAADRLTPVDADELNTWVDKVRALASEAGRTEVADIEIGKVLAYTTGDDDSTWPTKPARDLIERLGSPEIERGFELEVYNSRGPTSRGLLDGGEQERALVTRYSELADRIRDGWPRTAAVLSSLARGYEREALRHDEEAERFRQGMDR